MGNPLAVIFTVVLLSTCAGKMYSQDHEIPNENLLIFSAVRGIPGKPDTAVITRPEGNAGMVVFSVRGPHAGYFHQLGVTESREAGNQGHRVAILFEPGDDFEGIAEAELVMVDSNERELSSILLRGLCIPALEGANEPPLSVVVDVLGLKTNVGWTSLANHTQPQMQGSQIANTLFRKAGEGPVEIKPVARYSPPFSLPFGFYIVTIDGPTLHEVGALANSDDYPEHQTLFPGLASGTISFDPGDQSFGFYTESPTHTAYSQDIWNEINFPDYVSHATRIYPISDSTGDPYPDTYLLCFEEAQNGDYQDYVFLISNVRPEPSGNMDLSTVVLDASDFLDEIPGQHRIVDANQIGVPWLFNNMGLLMTTRTNYLKSIEIRETGSYYLYAQSHGRPGTTFRIAIDDEVIETDLASDSLSFDRVGVFELNRGEVDVRIMRIENNPVFDFLILSQNPDLTLDQIHNWQWDEEVLLLKEYDIPESSCVKFGDVTGDGRMDMMVLTRDYSAHILDSEGKELWNYKAPEEGIELRRSFEAPGLIWDLDEDGVSEVIHWRQDQDLSEWLVVANGQTGEVIKRCQWPTKTYPHEYNNFRLAIGSLRPGYPNHILVFTDMGGLITVTAYDPQLELLWKHEEEKKKDHLGHYVYPIDLDNDGVDEVVVSGLVLDAQGREIWNAFELFYDHHDHADSYRFADLDGDDDMEIVSAHSDAGVFAYDAISGDLQWQNVAEHTQQLEIGHFLAEGLAPQVAVGARTYGDRRFGIPYLWSQVHWLNAEGELLFKWPANPLNGNPVFVKGDWEGDGTEELFWFKFRMMDHGRGELFFGEPVYHMFDFMEGMAEEVITLEDGKLRVYGSKKASAEEKVRHKTPEYLKNKIANHTHY